ncbi:MAG: type II secretion system protein [Microgenomates group bacterium]
MKNEKLKIKGFTMIELLIVIAVLGVLAVAVLSAINPLEQINRGRDTGLRSDSEQILSAIDRFYTAQQYYPWQITVNNPADDKVDWQALPDAKDGNNVLVLDKLSQTGTEEIKKSFADRLKKPEYKLFIYKKSGTENSTYVCFSPRSASFQTEAANRCAGTKPLDWPASACNNTTDCGTKGNCICLP